MTNEGIGGGDIKPGISVQDEWETIIPVADQVLILPDPPKKKTKGGIVLPDSVHIPVLRGRVLAVSYMVISSYKTADIPEIHQIETGDRVIFHWGDAVPQDFEKEQSSVLISINNILAKIKPEKKDDRVRHNNPTGVV
jgi:co-chaperonin GroES (HSP10)